MKSFFSHVWNFMKKAFTNPKEEQAAVVALTYAGPILEEIVDVTAGEPAAQLVAAVINEAKKDLALAGGIISSIQAGQGGSLKQALGALNSVKSNLSGILAAGHVKDPATLQKVTGAVNLISGEVDAVISQLGAAA